MNICTIIGRSTKDVELKYLPGTGTAVSTFTVAVDRNLSKEKKQEAESKGYPTADFINVVAWGKTAEYVANYLGKGKLIAINGKIQTRSWDAQDGTKKYATEVVADNVQILQWKDDEQGGNNTPSTNNYQDNSEVIPF